MYVLQPAVSKSFDEGKDAEVRGYLGYSLKFMLMLAIPAATGLALLSKPLLLTFTTAEFAAEDGYLVIPFVAASQMMAIVYAITGWQIMMLAKKTGTLAIIWGMAAVANLGLNLIFVPHFGILAAAGTTLLANTLATAVTLYFSARELTFPVDWTSILKVLAASGVMAGVVLLVYPEGTGELALAIGLGVIVYTGALLALKGLTRGEIGFFYQLVKNSIPPMRRRG